MITGVDLIQEQLRAAQGQVLRFKQEDIVIKVAAQSLLPGDCTHAHVAIHLIMTVARASSTGWWCMLNWLMWDLRAGAFH